MAFGDNPLDFLQGGKSQQAAELMESRDVRPNNFQKITLALDTAATSQNPYKIPIPFRSIFVGLATDPSVKVSLALHENSPMALDNAIPLALRDSYSSSKAIAVSYLTWTAQAGKTISLWLSVDGNITSGTQISQNAGGVSINSGSSATLNQKTLAAASGSLIFAVDTTRKQGTFINDSGADLWVGVASTVTNAGGTKGIKIADGGAFSWQNTAALYGYSVAGFTLSTIEEF